MANPKLQVEISAKIDELTQGLGKAMGEVKSFATKAGDAIQKMAVPAGIASAAISAIGVSSVIAYGKLQSLEKGLAAVAGSSEEADKQLTRLREVAKLPGLGLEEAVRGSISLQAIGISAETAEKAILEFGNAVATVGKGRAELDRALYGLQQLANTDFPLGEDLNIIKDAIPQVSKLLDEAFGANRSDELAKMGVTSQQVVDVILNGLSELPRVAGGVENAIENMQDGVTEAWQELGKAINEALDVEGIMNKVGDALGGVVDWFRELDPRVRDAIVYLGAGAAAFTGLVAAAGAVIAIAPAVAGAFSVMTLGISAIVTALGIAAVYIVKNWEKIKIEIVRIAADGVKAISEFTRAIAEVSKSIGLNQLYGMLTGASVLLERKTIDLKASAHDMQLTLDEASKSIEATGNATEESAKKTTEIVNGLDGVTVSANNARIAMERFNNAQSAGVRPTTSIAPSTGNVQFQSLDTIAPSIETFASKAAAMFEQAFEPLVADGILNSIGRAFESMGNAFANFENPFKAFGQAALASIGDILVQFGKLTIAAGVAATGLAKALSAPLNPGSGIAAIAAGAALVAIGSAVKGFASNAASGASASVGGQGSSSGSGSASYGASYSSSFSNDRTVTFEIAGTKLIGVLRNAGAELQRYGG